MNLLGFKWSQHYHILILQSLKAMVIWKILPRSDDFYVVLVIKCIVRICSSITELHRVNGKRRKGRFTLERHVTCDTHTLYTVITPHCVVFFPSHTNFHFIKKINVRL